MLSDLVLLGSVSGGSFLRSVRLEVAGLQLAESIWVLVRKIELWIEFWGENNGSTEFCDGIIWKWPKVQIQVMGTQD
jgi:hypothetical protein